MARSPKQLLHKQEQNTEELVASLEKQIDAKMDKDYTGGKFIFYCGYLSPLAVHKLSVIYKDWAIKFSRWGCPYDSDYQLEFTPREFN